ncbi:MAG: Valine--pyruvate aminotransferase [Sporothrix thermara]
MVLVPLHPSKTASAAASAEGVVSGQAGPAKPLINLLRGWPAPSLLPVDLLKMATADVLADTSIVVDSLQYGPDSGFQPLREQLASYLSRVFAAYDVPSDPDRICITGGASQNAACILQSFTDPSYTACVWVSAPCYFLMCPIFEDSGFAGRLRAVPEDDEGINVEALERGFQEFAALPSPPEPAYKSNLAPQRKAYRHVVYVVPTSSNPSGKSMSVARREQLVRLARKYDALLIADDVYDFLQWDVPPADAVLNGKQTSVSLPPPLPRLVDVDRMLPREEGGGDDNEKGAVFGNAISNASFSKIVAPGLRTGWVEATPAFSNGLAHTGSSRSGGAPSQFSAATINVLMRTGEMDRYLQEVVRPALQWRHRLLIQAYEKHLSPFLELKYGGLPATADSADATTATYGGYFLWMKLRRADLSASAIAKRAYAEENLIIADGPLFEVKGDKAGAQFDDHIRLCFAWEDEDKMGEGVERLARVLRNWDEPRAAAELSSADADDFK